MRQPQEWPIPHTCWRGSGPSHGAPPVLGFREHVRDGERLPHGGGFESPERFAVVLHWAIVDPFVEHALCLRMARWAFDKYGNRYEEGNASNLKRWAQEAWTEFREGRLP